jgi:hypothetical protein
MIRPWYRSRLCWLGIPGLLFLLWAWWHSNFYHRTLILSESSHLSTTQGKLLWFSGLSDIEHDFDLNFRTGKVEVYEIVVGPGIFRTVNRYDPWSVFTVKVPAGDQAWFPPPRWQAREINRDTHFRLVSVPYWLLTGGYAAAWLGGVGLWQRRKWRIARRSGGGVGDGEGKDRLA